VPRGLSAPLRHTRISEDGLPVGGVSGGLQGLPIEVHENVWMLDTLQLSRQHCQTPFQVGNEQLFLQVLGQLKGANDTSILVPFAALVVVQKQIVSCLGVVAQQQPVPQAAARARAGRVEARAYSQVICWYLVSSTTRYRSDRL
jgi:hypothetical protein